MDVEMKHSGIAANPEAPNAMKKQINKELRSKANDFLNSRMNANNLVDIITSFEAQQQPQATTAAHILTLEVIFTELFKRSEFSIEIAHLKLRDESPETKYREWLRERYEETFQLILNVFQSEKINDATQALVTSMKLLVMESKFPMDKGDLHGFPKYRLRRILQQLLSTEKSMVGLFQRFKEYSEYLDVVFYSWKLMPHLATRSAFSNKVFALNYLELINVVPATKGIYDERKLLCAQLESMTAESYDYALTRKNINKVWNHLLQWTADTNETVHKQVLIILLERILVHLERPVLLTDFLMDSLDCGGAISLLALQGLFTLIQKHNITYPNIYEKLYSMFEPEIFHMKYKARLFYLADIFLSSTHLPENLVAAFCKRLARLSLIVPPQDAVIILYFIGNLILRHQGLKRLICASAAVEVARDPYIMEERDPNKARALESCLWEIVMLQKHAIPSVATAARFISQPLPTVEWNLASVLEIKEDDIFDQEITKKTKQYALAFERPQSLFLVKDDKVKQCWNLF